MTETTIDNHFLKPVTPQDEQYLPVNLLHYIKQRMPFFPDRSVPHLLNAIDRLWTKKDIFLSPIISKDFAMMILKYRYMLDKQANPLGLTSLKYHIIKTLQR